MLPLCGLHKMKINKCCCENVKWTHVLGFHFPKIKPHETENAFIMWVRSSGPYKISIHFCGGNRIILLSPSFSGPWRYCYLLRKSWWEGMEVSWCLWKQTVCCSLWSTSGWVLEEESHMKACKRAGQCMSMCVHTQKTPARCLQWCLIRKPSSSD